MFWSLGGRGGITEVLVVGERVSPQAQRTQRFLVSGVFIGTWVYGLIGRSRDLCGSTLPGAPRLALHVAVRNLRPRRCYGKPSAISVFHSPSPHPLGPGSIATLPAGLRLGLARAGGIGQEKAATPLRDEFISGSDWDFPREVPPGQSCAVTLRLRLKQKTLRRSLARVREWFDYRLRPRLYITSPNP